MRPSSVSLPVVDDDARRATGDDHCAGERHALAVSDRGVVGDRVGVLLRRHGLAGERRLFGAQVLRLDEPKVRGNLVAGLKQHDVARDELFGGKHASLPAAHRPGFGREHVANRIQRLLGPAFLDESEQSVENDHGKDDRRIDPQAQHQLGEPGGEKNVDKDIVELGEKPHERAPLLALRQAVRPIFLQPRASLGGVQAFFPVGCQPLHDLIGWHPMPGRAFTRRLGVCRCAHRRPPLLAVYVE